MSFSLDIIFYTPIVFVLLYLIINAILKTPRNVCVVVLGDIGRSPRMQYHAMSFSKEKFRVYLVGYKGTQPHEKLIKDENIQFYYVRELPAFLKYVPRMMSYIVKVIWQSVTLAWTLLLLPKMGSMLIQNPPSIPTMFICYIVCRLRFATLVIDWHNYGYSILAMAHRRKHPLVRLATWYEKFCGHLSTHNICVTETMKQDLSCNWGISALTVYDRPPEIFQSINIAEQHDLFLRLSKSYPLFKAGKDAFDATVFTEKNSQGVIVKLNNRHALLVSSTSWTEDEDFGILLHALQEYDQSSIDDATLPRLICIITGKGPQKDYYKEKIVSTKWTKVKFCLPWLTAEDYPKILGSADLGVCLHTSSSGMDLPMKVVDMFGCGLPVCAAHFKCLHELVQHEKNGMVFHSEQELCAQLKELLRGFPRTNGQLDLFRKNLKPFQATRWHKQWVEKVLPLFRELKKDKRRLVNPDLMSDSAFSEDVAIVGNNEEGNSEDK